MCEQATCDVCRRPIVPRDYGQPGEVWCSEFCAETTSNERDRYQRMEAGDLGLWPCGECGCVIDDLYEPSGCCAPCAPKREIRVLKAALTEALDQWAGWERNTSYQDTRSTVRIAELRKLVKS